jgi:hypothetical protein
MSYLSALDTPCPSREVALLTLQLLAGHIRVRFRHIAAPFQASPGSVHRPCVTLQSGQISASRPRPTRPI